MMIVINTFAKIAIAIILMALAKPATLTALEISDHRSDTMRIDGESNWIYIEGDFEDGDAELFEEFLKGRPLWRNQRIVLNSAGGSVIEAMIIGNIIRDNGFRTAVATSVKTDQYSEIMPGICASACVLAFAGGVERGASEGSRIGVHQMSRDYEKIYNRETITVDDLEANMSVTQMLVGLSLTHFLQMGIDPMIIPLMVGTSANDIRWLTIDEIRTTRIAFEPSQFSPWGIEPYGNGLVAFSRSDDGKKQLTLYCGNNGEMQFLLRMSGAPYDNNFINIVTPQQFTVAGATVAAASARTVFDDDALSISGPWSGRSEPSEYMSTFSLYGEVVGSISDIYSLYFFNRTNFTKSVDLASKNCV